MIEIDIRGVDPHPPFTAFPPADETGLFHDVAAHDGDPNSLSNRLLGGDACCRSRQMARQKRKDLFPAIERLFGPVGVAERVEEGVSGAIIAMEFVVFAKPLED